MSDILIVQVIGLLTVLTYLIVIFVARAHLIARSSISALKGRREAVLADALALNIQGHSLQAITDLTARVQEVTGRRDTWWSRLGSGGDEENAGWEMIHRAEEIIVRSLGDADVQARLRRARADLAGDDSACAREWRIVLDRHLDEADNPKRDWNFASAQADVIQLVERCHREQDKLFRSLAELANKTQWLVVAGLLLITAIILLRPQLVPLLGLGAVGGLASRVRLISNASALPTDYGAHWTPLFLAPVLGALLGCAGLYLVTLAAGLGVFSESVSATLSKVVTGDVTDPIAAAGLYGLAVLFGFTEGAFNGVASLVNDQLAAAPAAGVAAGAAHS